MDKPDDYVMPFGKYKGDRLDDIAKTNEGLRYLDWAAGEFDGAAGDAVQAYVDQDAVARDIAALVAHERDESHGLTGAS